MHGTHPTRRELRRAARATAEEFGGVLTLGRLAELGYDHAAVTNEVEQERWQRLGTHTVAVHTGSAQGPAMWWRAVWEVAHGVALVDGVSALQVAGLTGFGEPSSSASRQRPACARRCGPSATEGADRSCVRSCATSPTGPSRSASSTSPRCAAVTASRNPTAR